MCVRTDLRMEEDFWSQESLVPHVNGELFLADSVDPSVLFNPFRSIGVVFIKLFHQIGTHVTETFLKHAHTFDIHVSGRPFYP